MSADIKARLEKLITERAQAHEDTKVTLAEARTADTDGNEPGLTGELLVRYENADSAIERTSVEISALEAELTRARATADIIEETADDAGSDEERYEEAFDMYVRRGAADMSREDLAVLKRAQEIGTDPLGGFTVAEGFWNRISEVQRDFGGMESVANVITTSTGANLPWMTADTTAQVGEIVGEHQPMAEEDIEFGQRNLGAYKYTSKHIKASWEILQDSEVDMAGYIGRKLAERLARIHNQHQTSGTGVGQPLGLLTGVVAEVTAAAATPTHDELIELVYSLDPSYEANARFMMSKATLAEVRKVVDGDGNKVWTPTLVAGQPDLILSHPFTRNQDMPAPLAGNSAIAFGDFREAVVIRKVKGMELRRLDELFALNGQVAFVAWDRMDSTQDNLDALKVLAIA